MRLFALIESENTKLYFITNIHIVHNYRKSL